MIGPTNANGVVTKIGSSDVGNDLKPIKLVGGVPTAVTNDFVSTAGAQTVAGVKTLTDDLILSTTLNRQIRFKANGIANNTSTPTSQSDLSIKYVANNEDQLSNIIVRTYTNGDRAIRVVLNNTSGGSTTYNLFNALADGTTYYMQGPDRGYNSANTHDIATIGTLDAYTPMVRTSGNQTIAGVKTFTNTPIISYSGAGGTYAIEIDNTALVKGSAPSSATYPFYLTIKDKNGARLSDPIGLAIPKNATEGQIEFKAPKMDGTMAVDMAVHPGYVTATSRAYNASNIDDVVNISLLDAYTPMVRVTNNQTIGGTKTFTKPTDLIRKFATSALGWTLLYTQTNTNIQWLKGFTASSKLTARVSSSGIYTRIVNGLAERTYPQPLMKICTRMDGTGRDVWINAQYGAWMGIDIECNWIGYDTADKYDGISFTNHATGQTEPTVGDVYSSVIDSTDFNNER